jgi:hypothetical protein
MVSRRLWIPREELTADRTAQAQKMLGDAFKGVRGGLEDAANQTRDLFTQQREEWARKRLEEEMARARQQAEQAAAQAEQQRVEQERQAQEAQAQQQAQAPQVTGAQNGFLQGKLAPVPGVDIPEEGAVPPRTPGLDGPAKQDGQPQRRGLDGLRDTVANTFAQIGKQANADLPDDWQDFQKKAQETTFKSLTEDEGLLGTQGPLMDTMKAGRQVPGLAQALGGPAFMAPGARGGMDTLGRAGVRTARGFVESADTLREGTKQLERGDIGGGLVNTGMGAIGMVSPQFTALGNIAAEQALDAGADEEEAQAIGNVVGFFTPGGGIQQVGKAGAFLKGARTTGAIAKAGGAAERLARGTGNLFESADDIARGGALRALGPAGVAGVAAPIGGVLGYRQAQEEGADARSTALRTLGGAAAAADIGAGVSDMGLGALTGAARLGRGLPDRVRAAGEAARESTAVDGRAGIASGQDGRAGPSRALKIDAAGELVGGLAGAQIAGEQLTEEDDPWQKKAAAGAAGFVAGAGLGSQVRRNAKTLQRVGQAFATGEAAPRAVPKGRIIPPAVAAQLNLSEKVRGPDFGEQSGFLPTRMDILQTIRNTPGAKLSADGTLEVTLERRGKQRREGDPTGRGGVYYAGYEGGSEMYNTGSTTTAEGGDVKYGPRPSSFRNVLFVDDTGKMGRDIGSAFLGKARYQDEEANLRGLLEGHVGSADPGLRRDAAVEKFQEFGWSPEGAEQVTDALLAMQKKGYGLDYAVPEAIGSGLARAGGYEAAVGIRRANAYSDPKIGEVFDLRESHYPGQGVDEFTVSPEFTGTPRTPDAAAGQRVVDPVLKEIGAAMVEGRVPGGSGNQSMNDPEDLEVLKRLGLSKATYEALPQQAKLRLDDYLFNPDSPDRPKQLIQMMSELRGVQGTPTRRWSDEASDEGQQWGQGPQKTTQQYKEAATAPKGQELYLGNITAAGEYPKPGMVNYDLPTKKYVVLSKNGNPLTSNSYQAAELKLVQAIGPENLPENGFSKTTPGFQEKLGQAQQAAKGQAPPDGGPNQPAVFNIKGGYEGAQKEIEAYQYKPGTIMHDPLHQVWYVVPPDGPESSNPWASATLKQALEKSAEYTGSTPAAPGPGAAPGSPITTAEEANAYLDQVSGSGGPPEVVALKYFEALDEGKSVDEASIIAANAAMKKFGHATPEASPTPAVDQQDTQPGEIQEIQYVGSWGDALATAWGNSPVGTIFHLDGKGYAVKGSQPYSHDLDFWQGKAEAQEASIEAQQEDSALLAAAKALFGESDPDAAYLEEAKVSPPSPTNAPSGDEPFLTDVVFSGDKDVTPGVGEVVYNENYTLSKFPTGEGWEDGVYEVVNPKTGELGQYQTYAEAETALGEQAGDPDNVAVLDALTNPGGAKKAPGLLDKVKAAFKTLVAGDEESSLLGAVAGSSPFNQGEAPTRGDPDARPRRVSPPTPSAGEQQFGTPGIGPGERQVGAKQRPRPGEVDRRVQGVHKGGPMGQQKQVVEETPTDLGWKPGDPTPDPEELEAQGITPTGQQAYDIARQESDEITQLQDFITNAALEGMDVPLAVRDALRSARRRQGLRAQRLRESAEAAPGAAGQLARDSNAEAKRLSKTKAGQEAKKARLEAQRTQGILRQTGEPSTAVDGGEAGPITDAEGRAVASTGPDQVDLDGKPVAGAETVPEAVAKGTGKVGRTPGTGTGDDITGISPTALVGQGATVGAGAKAGAGSTMAPGSELGEGAYVPPGVTVPRGVHVTPEVAAEMRAARRALAATGKDAAPTGTAPAKAPRAPRVPTGSTPKGATTTTTTPATPGVPPITVSKGRAPGASAPPKTPAAPAAPTPKPEMARFGWLDGNGKLRPMGQLEEAFRKQELDDHKAWEAYQQELTAAKGDQRVGAQATAKYESLVRKRTAKRAKEIGSLTEDEVLELASWAGPESKDIRKLMEKAGVEMKGLRPDFVARDNLTNVARLNLIGGNPITVARNFLGGATNLVWHPIETAVASALDPALAKYYKHKGLDERLERRYGKETAYLFKGYARSFGAAMANAAHAVREGNAYTAQGLAEKLKAKRTRSAMSGRLAEFTDKVFTPLTATDAAFRTLTQGGELFRQQYRSMKAKGLSDAQIDKEITSLLQAPRDQFVQRMGSELAAQDLAKGVEEQTHYRAFTQSLDTPGRALQWVQQIPGAGPMLMPFITTPYNAAKFDLERSPAGALKQLGELATLHPKADLDKIASSGEMSDRLARGMIGSGLFFTLFAGSMTGLLDLNGRMPESQGERDEWEAEGRRPYSIRMGDRYVSFQDIPGLNAALTSAVVARDIWQEKGAENPDYLTAVAKGVLDATMSLAAKPMAGGVVEAIAAGIQPTRAASWARGAFTPLMPAAGMLRTWGTALDPMQRERPETPLEELQSVYRVFPGVPDLPERRDAVGNTLENWNYGLGGLLNPIRSNAATGFRVPSRYYGSEGARMDADINRAVEKIAAWEEDPRLPRPTGKDYQLAARGEGNKNDITEWRRANERSRLAVQKAQR